jgi:DNA-binding MarR family transcriptional regulator
MPSTPSRRAPARTPRAPPAELATHLGFWMRMVSNRVSGEFKRSVEALGVSVSEWVALRTLYGRPGATHGELVEALRMTKGAVSKIARSLEAKQLIARAPDASDGRAESLRLTPAGRALVPRLAAAADANEERFFGHLHAEERAALRELLASLASRHGIDEPPLE